MKLKLLALALVAGGSLFAGPRFFFGVNVGPSYGYYAPPPPVYAYAPAPPPPVYGSTWINGCWNWGGGRYAWHPGYYAHPPFAGGVWVGPRYYGGRYYNGYWRR